MPERTPLKLPKTQRIRCRWPVRKQFAYKNQIRTAHGENYLMVWLDSGSTPLTSTKKAQLMLGFFCGGEQGTLHHFFNAATPRRYTLPPVAGLRPAPDVLILYLCGTLKPTEICLLLQRRNYSPRIFLLP